ncbi:MAG: transglycosylase SLT domain-containing protein [Hoylesella marshii]|uniref:transglycosylase SLT domain-containing protein n=1 Tax=Hoylesella marshii TaxID=189722 RepID=UPI003FA14A91
MKSFALLLSLLALLFLSCTKKKEDAVVTPWGRVDITDSITTDKGFTLDDMIDNGEMIMLTLSGPDTYYDYRGRGMGTQYLLCEKFAQKIGVSLRVELCKDTLEMVKRLERGDADVIAFPLPKSMKGKLNFCGPYTEKEQAQWAVNPENHALADSLNHWFRPQLLAEARREERQLLTMQTVRRHVYAPMLNRAGGIISKYDRLFMMYAPVARMDWRLLAAQCYQESCFDPKAQSWAGACGLMQILPSTATHLGLPHAQLYEPEANIAAAVRYLQELSDKFRDVPDRMERIHFVLGSYNGGYLHIRDAMALATKHGKNRYQWGDVSDFVLKLSDPRYYRDPVVKYGYMRGTETADYVYKIKQRWRQYRGVARDNSDFGISGSIVPHRAKKKNKYKI